MKLVELWKLSSPSRSHETDSREKLSTNIFFWIFNFFSFFFWVFTYFFFQRVIVIVIQSPSRNAFWRLVDPWRVRSISSAPKRWKPTMSASTGIRCRWRWELRFERPFARAGSKSPGVGLPARIPPQTGTFCSRKVQSVEGKGNFRRKFFAQKLTLCNSLGKRSWSAIDSSAHSTCRTRQSTWKSWLCLVSSFHLIRLPSHVGKRTMSPRLWAQLIAEHWWWATLRSSVL